MTTSPSSAPAMSWMRPPGWRVLGGVGQEVHEDLLQPRRVGVEPQVGGREREQQLVLPLLDERPDGLDGLMDEARGVDDAPCGAGSCPG